MMRFHKPLLEAKHNMMTYDIYEGSKDFFFFANDYYKTPWQLVL